MTLKGKRRGKPPEFVPPDLGLGAAKQQSLEVQVRHLVFRWQPRTEDPNNLARDIYALIAWVLDGDDPPSVLTDA